MIDPDLNDTKNKRISWVNILYAVIQALVAALTALGVSSCTKV